MSLKRIGLACALIAHGVLLSVPSVQAAPSTSKSTGPLAPAGMLEQLSTGVPQDVIVEFNSTAIDTTATQMRKTRGIKIDNKEVLDYRSRQYQTLKTRVRARAGGPGWNLLHDYSHLPMVHLRLDSAASMQSLLADTEVKAIYKDEPKYPVLDSAGPALINLPSVTPYGVTGAGTTVAVIDSGADYTLSDFGCTSPGVPAGCKISTYQRFAGGSALDFIGHGSNVAGIVVGVATGAKIAALNVFGDSATTSDSTVVSAVNWAIANKATYNIVAMNLSLGDNVNHTSACSGTAYQTPFQNAFVAGIDVYVASGNNGFNNGVTSPACVNAGGVVPVGAVYAANIGSASYSVCSDGSTAPDQVTCFTNAPTGAAFSNFILAPGASVTAGGQTYSGTSQATPFVAGVDALIKSIAQPNIANAQNYAHFVSGPTIAISRPGYSNSWPRLDAFKSLQANGDPFSIPMTMSLARLVSDNYVSNKEAGEPNHAGNAGGRSVWATWTAPASGLMTFDTHGSTFDTLLAVYTGSSVSALTQVAANDDDGSGGGASGVSFAAVSGTTYKIAIDGKNGAFGFINMTVHPANDSFASRTLISGASGSANGSLQFASAEAGEKTHAGVTALSSIWWKWVAPSNGQVMFDTHGSNIDTTLDAETGSTVSTTTVVASNNNDGVTGGVSKIAFNVTSGTEYQIAVDRATFNSSYGANLNWQFSSSPTVDLALSLNGGTSGNGAAPYTAVVTNNGPFASITTSFAVALPAGISYQSASGTLNGASIPCSVSGQVVTCTIGTMLPGQSANIQVNGSASAVGTYTANATVSSSTTDTSSANNSASANEVVTAIPLASSNGDAPLPLWAYVLLALGFMAGIQRKLNAQNV
jgi:Subtilase family/Domain of unknown function DUF11